MEKLITLGQGCTFDDMFLHCTAIIFMSGSRGGGGTGGPDPP